MKYRDDAFRPRSALMMKRYWLVPAFIAIAAGIAWVQWKGAASEGTESHSSNLAWIDKMEKEPIEPIPATIELDAKKVALGEMLFLDASLSHDNTVACANCHRLRQGGADNLQYPVGIAGRRGDFNTPTVFNSGFNFRQFWDGRALSLEDQINGPISNEMGSNWPEIVGKLGANRNYAESFKAIYPDGIQAANIRDAIATFERSLITPNSRFDRWLRGDKRALAPQEQEGYRLFKSYGCASCHQGMLLGGNLFERLGVMREFFTNDQPETAADLGRYNHTHIEEHKHQFKVPGLRNVALTAPYLHNGSAETLEQAIMDMAEHQLGVEIPRDHIEAIVAFLKTLTGEYQGKPL